MRHSGQKSGFALICFLFTFQCDGFNHKIVLVQHQIPMLNSSVWFANLLSPIFNVLIGSVFAADSVDRGVMIGACILIQRVSKTSRNIFGVSESENAALACFYQFFRCVVTKHICKLF